jgi:acyl-coenzyme A synthetase/AMP-(fatty) acid ligase
VGKPLRVERAPPRSRSVGGVEFLGRIDPIVKVHGQLVALTDIISVLVEHPFVHDAEVADVHQPAAEPQLVAWVVLIDDVAPDKALAEDLRRHVHEALGGLAHPSGVGFASAFPSDVPRRALRDGLRLLTSEDDRTTRCASEEDIRKAVERVSAIGNG